ncbi:MAG: HAD-IA family hydrolase [Ilumatobacteraceae bacterium]
MTVSTPFAAVLWDFGGVILSSPFEAFNRFEIEHGIPLDTIRRLNATDPDTNAWARFERSEISAAEFDTLFAVEAEAAGHRIRGYEVLALLRGDIRPEMVRALDLVRSAGYKTACLTNNVHDPAAGSLAEAAPSAPQRERDLAEIMARFDAVVESSKVGVRKPEPAFYEIACDLLQVAPVSCVFLDDLGVNLKPAAAMGMTTIKVHSADQALTDLEGILGLTLR